MHPSSSKAASVQPGLIAKLTATFSVVAIHGIGAHPDDTWCKNVDIGHPEERYVNWLKDPHMLPKVLPQARIMRYGYASQWFGDDAIVVKTSTVAERLLRSLNRERRVHHTMVTLP